MGQPSQGNKCRCLGAPGDVGVSLEVSKLSFMCPPTRSSTPSLTLSLTSTNLNSAFSTSEVALWQPEVYSKVPWRVPTDPRPGRPQCGSSSRDLGLRPRTNLTKSVMQEPTTTTAASSSCQGLPGSPDAAITNPRSCSTRTLPFALCLTP